MEKITKKIHTEMLNAFDEIQMPRTPYTLENLVVNTKFTEEQKYAQCVLEMSIAYDNLRLAKLSMSVKQLDIDDIKGKSKRDELEKAKLEIELEQTQRAVLGAEREFSYLYSLWRKFPKQYTREDLNNASPLEYQTRLKTQALQDLESSGRISVSNLEGLRQVDIKPSQLGLPIQQDPIEQKYLKEGKAKCLMIIPSEHRLTATQVDELLKDVVFPTNIEMRIENISESDVASNYNIGFQKAIAEGCTYICTLERDQILEPDSLIRLFEFAMDNPDACVGAWYPKRQKVRQGVHIELNGAHRRFMKDDGEVHICKTMAMGLSLYPIDIIRQLDYPYCITTTALSQDSYLTEKIRELGYECLVNTDIKIGHKDMVSGEIYY